MKTKLCYYNQKWNIYFETEEKSQGIDNWIQSRTQIGSVPYENGEFRLYKYFHSEIPVFGFGFWEYSKEARPGHGGEWSSNSTAINSMFGTELIEVAVDSMAVAVPLSWLKKLLGGLVVWEERNIVAIKGKENAFNLWVELKSFSPLPLAYKGE